MENCLTYDLRSNYRYLKFDQRLGIVCCVEENLSNYERLVDASAAPCPESIPWIVDCYREENKISSGY